MVPIKCGRDVLPCHQRTQNIDGAQDIERAPARDGFHTRGVLGAHKEMLAVPFGRACEPTSCPIGRLDCACIRCAQTARITRQRVLVIDAAQFSGRNPRDEHERKRGAGINRLLAIRPLQRASERVHGRCNLRSIDTPQFELTRMNSSRCARHTAFACTRGNMP